MSGENYYLKCFTCDRPGLYENGELCVHCEEAFYAKRKEAVR